MKKAFYGELIGTFMLVFFGCASVAVSTLFSAYEGLFQIATLWGIGLTLGILVSAPLSGAHLNPAMSIAFACFGDFPKQQLPRYLMAQILGAFLAALTLYFIFGEAIVNYETSSHITRSHDDSIATARFFGEFHSKDLSLRTAFGAEFLGTAFLSFVIFSLIDKSKKGQLPEWLVPPLIGLTLTLLISLFAPLSQAGFNPARDFAPRLFSALSGWKTLPFTFNGWSWLWVYLVAPILGALLGAKVSQKSLALTSVR